MTLATPYAALIDHFAQKRIDLDSDTFKVVLMTASAAPNLATDDFANDLTNELSTVSTTLSSGPSAGATTISVAASIPVGNLILIDSTGTPEVRTVTAVSGAGPYTLTVAALSSSHASGAPVAANPGYTTGGVTLSSVTWAKTEANSWGTSRANSTAYAVGAVVRPATGNGYLYQAIAAGTSGGSIPTYPTTVGQTVVDGGVTWQCVGRRIWQWDSADPAWSPTTNMAAAYGAIVDTTPGTAATNPLIGLYDFGGTVTSTNAAFTIVNDPLGILYFIV